MKAEFVLGIFLLFSIGISLFAQEDSTFISYYYPNSQTHPYWSFFNGNSDLKAANVFETYDNNFVLQSVGTFHYPPPEVVFDQSPMMLYNRQGVYQGAVFGPVDGNGSLLHGHYERIIKDGMGGYLALNSSTTSIDRLDSNLNYVGWVILEYTNGSSIYPKDILPDSTGFVLIGLVTPPALPQGNFICAKFDFNLNIIWHHLFQSNDYWHSFLSSTSDGGFLFSFFDLHSRVHFKVSSQGDALWLASGPTTYVTQIVETNDKYFGLNYSDYDINSGRLYVYDFGTNFSNPNPTEPIQSIVTYRLLGEDDVFSSIRTADGSIILAVSTPNGEIFRYDSDFNLIWSADYLEIERIGVGKTPVIELDNGDLLYCNRMFIQGGYTDRLALVRIDSNGHITPISDDYQETPFPFSLKTYPNPMKSNINIEFVSDKPVKEHQLLILIYNIKGQFVREIEMDRKSVNQYSAAWDGNDNTGRFCSNGTYIIKVNTGNEQITKKIALLK